MIKQVGNGLFVLGGKYVELHNQIQNETKQFIKTYFNGEEIISPSILSVENTKKCNYLDSFPNQAQMVSRHLDGLELGMNSPTVCYHLYSSYANGVVDGNKTYVMTGKCSRFEKGELNDLTRLLQFTGQEIVHIGSYDYVEDCFAKSVNYVKQIFDYFELDYKFETASDPFFGKNRKLKIRSQKIHGSKIEYKLYFPNEDKYLPVGSFNFVGPSFHKRFNITNSETEDVASGCWGWGLERLIYGIISQKGEDFDFILPPPEETNRHGYKSVITHDDGWYRMGRENYWFASVKMSDYKNINVDFKDIEFEIITSIESLRNRKSEIILGLDDCKANLDWDYLWTYDSAEKRIENGHILKVAFHNNIAIQWDWYFLNEFTINDHDEWSVDVKLPKNLTYSAHWYCHPKYRSNKKYPTFIKDFISASYNWSYNNGYITDVCYLDGWNWKSISVVKKMGQVGSNWIDKYGSDEISR
jgi:hypothetical protein